MFTLNQQLHPDPAAKVDLTLRLTAEERTRSRFRFATVEGPEVQLVLARGTVLRAGDLLTSADGAVTVRVEAKAEPVLTVRADAFALLRMAYHLGNRHVPIELTPTQLRLSPDPVLAQMLLQLGAQVTREEAPFTPEAGAYAGGNHDAGHRHGA